MKKWQRLFDERQLRLIENCKAYGENDPAGLPGHNLMLIIHKMEGILQIQDASLEELFELAGDFCGGEQKAAVIGDREMILMSQLDHLAQNT